MTILSRKGICSDTAAKMRRDLITGRWVIFNPARAHRPRPFVSSPSSSSAAATAGSEDKKKESQSTQTTATSCCPFCPGSEHSHTPKAVLTFDKDCVVLPNELGPKTKKDWMLRVVPNAFPAVTPFDAALADANFDTDTARMHQIASAARGDVVHHYPNNIRDKENDADGSDLNAHLEIPALGFHEVVIECRQHDTRANTQQQHRYSAPHVRRLMRAWHARGRSLRDQDPLIRQILYFKNNGPVAGASQPHPHAQIVALPLVGQEASERMASHLRHFTQTNRSVFDDVLSSSGMMTTTHQNKKGSKTNNKTKKKNDDGKQTSSRSVLVCENDDFVAHVPFAALAPYTVRIFSKSRQQATVAHFENETEQRIDSCAELLAATMQKVDKHLNLPDFNLVLSTPPLEGRFERAALRHDAFTRWYVTLTPALGSGAMAGFEIGSGIMSNSTLPEDCASRLRDVSILNS